LKLNVCASAMSITVFDCRPGIERWRRMGGHWADVACFGTWITYASYVPVSYIRGGNGHDYDNGRADNITLIEATMPYLLPLNPE